MHVCTFVPKITKHLNRKSALFYLIIKIEKRNKKVNFLKIHNGKRNVQNEKIVLLPYSTYKCETVYSKNKVLFSHNVVLMKLNMNGSKSNDMQNNDCHILRVANRPVRCCPSVCQTSLVSLLLYTLLAPLTVSEFSE